MNFIIKQKTSEEESQLLLCAWNSLKYQPSPHKEGVSFQNLALFILMMNNVYLEEEMKEEV